MLSVLKYLTQKSGPEESLSWAQSNMDKGFFVHGPSSFTPYFSNLNKWSKRVLIDVSHGEFFKLEKMLCTSKSRKKSTLMGFLQLEYTSLIELLEKVLKTNNIKAEMKNNMLNEVVPKVKEEQKADVFHVKVE
ncbi:hypothetical protein DVH24_013504 [Malus domestica]|uniref:Uncharacterized protein n=1 Tax=Malus domestica TaxID=3750 RepID=A0A498HGZ5_MALDO|nr:hypothetical protein DVH24_013504 [Malus domestica]